MGPAEFGRLTPRELDALAARRREMERREDFRAAQIACILDNMFQPKTKPAKPVDRYMLDPWPRQPKTWQAMLGQVEAINAAWGGKPRS